MVPEVATATATGQCWLCQTAPATNFYQPGPGVCDDCFDFLRTIICPKCGAEIKCMEPAKVEDAP